MVNKQQVSRYGHLACQGAKANQYHAMPVGQKFRHDNESRCGSPVLLAS